MIASTQLTQQVIEDLKRARPQFRKRDRVFIRKGPFDGYNSTFITRLIARVQPIATVEEGRDVPDGTPPDPAANWILAFDKNNHLYVELRAR